MLNDPRVVLDLIPPGARVLDIGAAEAVFPRANAVVDILPYAERKPGPLKELPEQFGPGDWYVGDICETSVWSRFGDKSFDFVICSHVLEDIRDPVFVCRQMARVGKRGYIETPSRFRECAKSGRFATTAGWEHHRWLVDLERDTLVFTAKNPLIHQHDCLPEEHRGALYRTDLTVLAVLWEGGVNAMERSHKGSTWEVENLFDFYRDFDYATERPPYVLVSGAGPARPTFEWITGFRLPIEERISEEEVLRRHNARLALQVAALLYQEQLRRHWYLKALHTLMARAVAVGAKVASVLGRRS